MQELRVSPADVLKKTQKAYVSKGQCKRGPDKDVSKKSESASIQHKGHLFNLA